MNGRTWDVILNADGYNFDAEPYRKEVPGLIDKLSDPECFDRDGVIMALGKLGRVAVPALAPLNRLTQDGDREIRANSLIAILRIQGYASQELLAMLDKEVREPDDMAMSVGGAITELADRLALDGMVEHDPPDCIHRIVKMLEWMCEQERNAFLRSIALRSLIKFGAKAKDASQTLVKLAGNPDRRIANAATALLRVIQG